MGEHVRNGDLFVELPDGTFRKIDDVPIAEFHAELHNDDWMPIKELDNWRMTFSFDNRSKIVAILTTMQKRRNRMVRRYYRRKEKERRAKIKTDAANGSISR